MAYHSAPTPAAYRIATGAHPETGRRAYYVLRQDDHDTSCWREIAGPYVQRGGAIQRLDRIIARGPHATHENAPAEPMEDNSC